jgi:hypothetical protein
MKYRRNAAIAAGIARLLAAPIVIGALAAAAALFAGLSAANAQQLVPATPAAAPPAAATTTDELTQLRANQQLLQQRLDQLEQIAQVGPAHPQLPPGTASLAGSFPRSFLIPGTDTSIQIGGFVEFDAADFLTAGNSHVSSVVAPPDIGVSGTATTPVKGHFAEAGQVFAASTATGVQNGVMRFGASNSRLFIETRTPTAWGEALTHLEFDFQGCTANADPCSDESLSTTPALPRLRLAYGTLGGFMAGQNWVPVTDLEAADETLNASGEAGVFGFARAPEVGYKTPPLPWMWNGTIGVYAIQPETSLGTPGGAVISDTAAVGSCAGITEVAANSVSSLCTNSADSLLLGSPLAEELSINPTKMQVPDANVVLNWEEPWGHFQLKGIAQDLDLNDGIIAQNFIGYGGGFSGNVKPNWFGWSKDNLGFQAWMGDGLGHYGDPSGSTMPTIGAIALASNYGFAGPPGVCFGSGLGCYGNTAGSRTAALAAFVHTTTVQSQGANVNYQHWWTDVLRTNMSFGTSYYDYPIGIIAPFGAQAGNNGYNKMLTTAMADLLWSPVPFINTGFEYFYGHRLTVWNQRGDQNEIMYSFIVKF